ncbi:MAG: CYTH domain-containing protein [Candidatus Paceibacterota bacterium]
MYEVEIKSLLGSKKNAEELQKRLEEHGRELSHHGSHAQLNHYFSADEGAVKELREVLASHVPEGAVVELEHVIETGENHSVRTREADGEVLVVIKASVGDDTSENGVSRIEFQEPVDLSLDELDDLLLEAGFSYQAKWSREREEYTLGDDVAVTIDLNAGYGYLAELEKEVESEDEVPEAEKLLRKLLDELELEELSQDRLERMFTHYNENWEDYYGTEETFTIE